jgi:hypothetical protein
VNEQAETLEGKVEVIQLTWYEVPDWVVWAFVAACFLVAIGAAIFVGWLIRKLVR